MWLGLMPGMVIGMTNMATLLVMSEGGNHFQWILLSIMTSTEVNAMDDDELKDYELEYLARCERCHYWNGQECVNRIGYCDFEERGEYEGIHCKD